MVTTLIYVFIFLLGLVFGSMINVLIFRLPLEEDVVVKPSHCMKCQNRIKPYDLIPVISYILLRGKCRHCGEKISIQYPLIELLTGFIFIGIFYRFGWVVNPSQIQFLPSEKVFNLFAVFTLAIIFIPVFFIDLKHYIIPDELIIFGLISGAVFALLKSIKFLFLGLNIIKPIVFNYGFLKDAGLGLLIGFGTFMIIVIAGEWIMKAEAMGMGDVKLMGVVGLFLGFKLTVLAMFLSFIIGSIVSIFLLVTKLKGRKDQIPFGPFIVAGSITTLLWGTQILNWYFSLGRV